MRVRQKNVDTEQFDKDRTERWDQNTHVTCQPEKRVSGRDWWRETRSRTGKFRDLQDRLGQGEQNDYTWPDLYSRYLITITSSFIYTFVLWDATKIHMNLKRERMWQKTQVECEPYHLPPIIFCSIRWNLIHILYMNIIWGWMWTCATAGSVWLPLSSGVKKN